MSGTLPATPDITAFSWIATYKQMTGVGASLSVHKERGQHHGTVIDVTREALIERRLAILAGLGMDEASFVELSETRTLTGDE